MTYGDTQHRLAFKNAIFKIAGSRAPKRSILNCIGAEAARLAGRARAWHGAHLYVLLHGEKWPAYRIHADLFSAVMKLSGMDAMNGKRSVVVYARGVRAGAVILGRSRKCAWRKCKVHFVGAANQKYCTDTCGSLAHADQRKRAAKERRERARRLAARRRNEKRRK